MRGAYMQVTQMAERHFPGMQAVGSNYPVPDWKMALVRALQAVQYGLLAVCMFGDQIFQYLGVAPPQLYVQNVVPNRFGAVIGVWFVGNMLVNTLQSTGAFEVYFDGQLIFSKLQMGRMPTVPEIFEPMERIIAQAMRVADGGGPAAAGEMLRIRLPGGSAAAQ